MCHYSTSLTEQLDPLSLLRCRIDRKPLAKGAQKQVAICELQLPKLVCTCV